MKMKKTISSYTFEQKIFLSLGIFGIFYVCFALSPSSYGIMLEQLGLKGSGLWFGSTRPIRSDEWAVVTPLTQATVNNGFARFNLTSLYAEDLRINYGLPIFDWGMLFKPSYWGYMILPAAMAYSLHFYLMFVLFIVGYANLFKLVCKQEKYAYFWSFTLFFTGFVQFWWNEKGSLFAYFPWLVLLILNNNIKLWVRCSIFYFVATVWFLTNLYPPIQVSLAFVGLVLFLSCKDKFSLKELAGYALASILSCLTVFLYLYDYLIKTSQTVYPGGRNTGGGGVPETEWLSQFFPTLLFDSHYREFSQNICEVGTVGAFVMLMCLFFLNYNAVFDDANKLNKATKTTFFGLLMMTAWMLLPLPAWMGKPLLWNNVQPERMEYAAGLLLLFCTAQITEQYGLVINRFRAILFVALFLAIWWKYKLVGHGGVRQNFQELIFIVVFIAAYTIRVKMSWSDKKIIFITSLFSSILVFAPFNPIQSAWPIFAQKNTPVVQSLKLQENQNAGVLVTPGYAGATLNGLGFKSASHVTPVPALAFWKQYFSAMPDEEFNQVFNRYSHINFKENISKPFSPSPDQVTIPLNLLKIKNKMPL